MALPLLLDPEVDLMLPIPPSANKLWQPIKVAPWMVRSKAYRAWETEAGWMAKRGKRKPIPKGPFGVMIVAGTPTGRRRDLDNLIKPILDLLHRQELTPDDKHCSMIMAAWSEQVDPFLVRVQATVHEGLV